MQGRSEGEDASNDFLRLPGVRPIAHLFEDARVTEIMINGAARIFIERDGKMQDAGAALGDERAVAHLVDSILRPTGRSVDARVPYVDCRLPDGSRVNIVLAPLSLGGTAITIRRATKDLRNLGDLVTNGAMSAAMARFLAAAMKAKLNVVFSGGTGTGKTTTLALLAREIPDDERIIVIEDTAELVFDQPNVVRLEARRASVEGSGAVSMEDLLRNALRMRPTRIVLGELRGAEAVEMLQAAATGHDGCLSVLHAGTPLGAIGRLEMMVTSARLGLPQWAIRRQIAGAVDIVVQSAILRDGKRRITHVTEVASRAEGPEEERLVLYDLYRYAEGTFQRTERVPAFRSRFEERGVALPSDLVG